MKAVILAAGYATRLYPLTINFPKPLLTVARKEIITHLIEKIEETGYVDEAIVVTNDRFYPYFEKWAHSVKTKMKVRVFNDLTTSNEDRLGAVGDLRFALNKAQIDDDVIVLAADNLFDFSLKEFIEFYFMKKAPVITVYDIKDMEKIKKYSCAEVDANGKVMFFEEKPKQPRSTLTSPPFYIYPKERLAWIGDYIFEKNNPDNIGSLVQYFYKKTPVYAFLLKEKRYDIGSLEDYNKTNELFEGRINGKKLELDSFESYKKSSVRLIEKRLKEHYGKEKFFEITIEDVKKDIKKLNAYSGIENMKEVDHKEIFVIEENIDTSKAEKAVLEGKVFWEHAAAGEATRLGIGTKYLIKPKDLCFDKIRDMLAKDGEDSKRSDEELLKEIGCEPEELMDISLGARHMVQLVFDIRRLAEKNNMDADDVIKKQKMLIILNENTSKKISEEIMKMNFFGLASENVLFMEQKSFHGVTIDNGMLFYHEKEETGDPVENRRLHNHGQMIMQKVHDDSIFRFVSGEKRFLRREEYFDFIADCEDMISYNIEDLGYLTNSIDLASLETALMLKDKGYHMVMEVVGQNPIKPQKGASLFFDEKINKNVMVESFRLWNIKDEDLKLMNKNFNHYPRPVESLKKMMEHGLPLGFEVKKGEDEKEYIYLCPVQGDLNFIVETAYVTRKKLKPIYNWKNSLQTTKALKAMKDQDSLPGFKEFVNELKLI